MKFHYLVMASALAFAASAQAAGGEGGYVVGSVGSTKLKVDKSAIDNELIGLGVTNLSSSVDESDTGYKLAFGYRYNQNLALEVGYANLGKAKYSATGTFAGAPTAANAEIKADGWTIAAIGILPINNAFSIFGKIGTIDATVKGSATATVGTGFGSSSSKSTKWKGNYGIGADYNFTPAIGVRAEYEVFSKLGDDNVGKSDVDMLSIGLVVKF